MIKDARLFHFSVSTVKLSWQVDQWWCDEEKECLGFHDTKDRVNLNKFSGTINSLSKTVKAIQKDIASIASSTSSNYKFVDCRIEEIFDIPSIKGVTKKFVRSYPGDVPVYGGGMKESPVGYIEDGLEDVKYFSTCLAWNREGSVGCVLYHNHRFTTTDHHRPLHLKSKYKRVIDLIYMKHAIQEALLSQGFRWSVTAGKEKVGKTVINIPIIAKRRI